MTAHFTSTCGLLSDLVTCNHTIEHGHTWHRMSLLRRGVIKQHKTQIQAWMLQRFPSAFQYVPLGPWCSPFLHPRSWWWPYIPGVLCPFPACAEWLGHDNLPHGWPRRNECPAWASPRTAYWKAHPSILLWCKIHMRLHCSCTVA